MSLTYGLEESRGVGWQSQPGWDRVHSGLSIYYSAMKLLLWTAISYVGVFLLAFIAQSAALAGIMGIGILIAMLVSQVMILIGLSRLTAVPPESRASGLMQIAFIGFLVSLVTGLVSGIMTGTADSMSDVQTAQMIQLIGTVCSAVGFVCLIIGLGRMGNFIDRPDIAGSARNLMVMGALLLGVVLVPRFMPQLILGSPMLFLIAMLVLGLVFLVMFMNLVGTLRDAIANGATIDVDAF